MSNILKILKNYFKPIMASISFITFISPTLARITPLAFKDVTSHFQADKAFYSPTLGMVALESGLIYNLRFYGNFIASYKIDKDGNMTEERDYHNDTSQDPLWNVVKILFPSGGGDLNPISLKSGSFGVKVNSPETIAILLDFAHRSRFQKGLEKGEDHPKSLSKVKARRAPDELPVNVIKTKFVKNNLLDLTPDQFKQLQDPTIKKIKLENFQKEKWLEIMESPNVMKPQEKIITNDQLLDQWKELIFKSLLIEGGKHIKLKQTIKQLLEFIKESIAREQQTTFYPQYTTEQVILAFFCEKFNEPEDISTLLDALFKFDHNHEMMASSAKNRAEKAKILFKKEDLLLIAQKKMPDIDDFYILANSDIFDRVTSYKAGTKPVSNGSTRAYNRTSGKEETSVFPDCVEVTMRHILNLMLYNSFKKQFDLTHLIKSIESTQIDEQIMRSLQDFYQKQSPLQANSGDQSIRSLWNRVVGDLNTIDRNIPSVFYVSGATFKYDMDPGFINVINAFRKMFGLTLTLKEKKVADLDLKTANLSQKKEWIEAYFATLFQILNPDRTYKIDTEALKEGQGRNQRDIFGELGVIVEDQNSKKLLFSFKIKMQPGHSELLDLIEALPKNSINYTADLSTAGFAEVLVPNTSNNSLKLLVPQMKESVKEDLYILYYDIFQDNDARIEGLRRIIQLTQAKIDPKFLELTLTHLLINLSWDDEHIVEKATPLILKIAPLFPEIIQKQVKSIKITDQSDNDDLSNLQFFVNLEYLDASVTKNFTQLSLIGLPHLKTLNLSKSNIASLRGLNECIALEELYVDDTPITHLSLTGLIHLKELDISYSQITTLTGLNECIALETLNARNTPLTQLSLTGLTHLKDLNLFKSNIASLTGLNECIALEKLNVGFNPLTQLSLTGLTHLKDLNISKSNVKELIGLEHLNPRPRIRR